VQKTLLAFLDDVYEDLEYGNLVSSRTPKDLAPFAKAMVDFLSAT
jgi:hypothetical protein